MSPFAKAQGQNSQPYRLLVTRSLVADLLRSPLCEARFVNGHVGIDTLYMSCYGLHRQRSVASRQRDGTRNGHVGIDTLYM